MREDVFFISSLIFLVGILMVTAAMFESVQARYPKIMVHGFLLAVLSIAVVAAVAFFTA